MTFVSGLRPRSEKSYSFPFDIKIYSASKHGILRLIASPSALTVFTAKHTRLFMASARLCHRRNRIEVFSPIINTYRTNLMTSLPPPSSASPPFRNA